MKKIYKFFFLLALPACIILTQACGSSGSDESKDDNNKNEVTVDDKKVDDVAKFESKDGNFKITFPAKPTESSENIPTEVGNISTSTFMYEKSSTEAYMVAYSDYPSALIELSNTDDLLTGARDGVVNNISGTVDKEDKITLGDSKGLYFRASSTTFYLVYKLYLVKNRLYQIGIMRDGSYPAADDEKAFIDSFELI
ncbi:MAG: hypothetical protein KKA07_15855 [Bacteroidetes bacterium]|nr:hypothetical protein [Bacteroidota bacterium]MBU1720538.1 hypothetical protein [Bacteroidota bacterium]